MHQRPPGASPAGAGDPPSISPARHVRSPLRGIVIGLPQLAETRAVQRLGWSAASASQPRLSSLRFMTVKTLLVSLAPVLAAAVSRPVAAARPRAETQKGGPFDLIGPCTTSSFSFRGPDGAWLGVRRSEAAPSGPHALAPAGQASFVFVAGVDSAGPELGSPLDITVLVDAPLASRPNVSESTIPTCGRPGGTLLSACTSETSVPSRRSTSSSPVPDAWEPITALEDQPFAVACVRSVDGSAAQRTLVPRPWADDDEEAIVALKMDSEVRQYLGGPQVADKAFAGIAAQHWGDFAVTMRDCEDTVGTVSFDRKHGRWELSLQLRRD